MTLFARWLRFNAGGLYGFLLQLLALALLSRVLPLSVATAIAVEAAVIHNFLWHEFYTWRDRRHEKSMIRRFFRFQLTNGLTSIFANVVITDYLHAEYRMFAVLANILAVLACSVINFAAAEWLVFTYRPKPHPEDREMLFI
jgi:putative flippase GtrA